MNSLVPVENYGQMKSMAADFVRTNLLPNHIKTPEQACYLMLKGAELGIPPIHALEQIYLIQGKTTMKAELMKAQVHAKMPNAIFRIKSTDAKKCVIEAARPGDEPTVFTYSMDDAKAAGDANKDQYKKRPATMLRWRCIAEVCRSIFPDCIMGVSYTPEELGAEIDEEGAPIVIDVDTQPPPPPKKPEPKQIASTKEEMAKPELDEIFEQKPHQRHHLGLLLDRAGIKETNRRLSVAKQMKGKPWKDAAVLIDHELGIPF